MIRNSWKCFHVLKQNNFTTTRFVKQSLKNKHIQTENVTGFDIVPEEPINAFFLAKTIGCSYNKCKATLDKHPELLKVKRKDLLNTVGTLKAFNYGSDDISSKPMILYTNAKTLTNRYCVLQECGIKEISLSLLFKYLKVMNKSATTLKSFGHIPFECNVIEQLRKQFKDTNVHIPKEMDLSEALELKEIREKILNCYLIQRLKMNDDNLEKMWKVYSRQRHKSFQAVQDVIHILLNDLKFPEERIIKNCYLLHGDADNIQNILKTIIQINGQSIVDIAYRRPKILMSSCESLQRTLEYVKAFGISEDAIMRCLEVLTLGSETVLDRLRDLNEIEQFQALGSNPRVLRLVHYQNKARVRLEYLNQLKVRCASLHILSCGSVAFAKFARDGSDRTRGRDVIVYLSNLMKEDENDVRNVLSRHPNWCHIPVVHVKQCTEYLLQRKFNLNDIYHSIHILLYPIQRIEEKLLLIESPDYFEDIQFYQKRDLTPREILTLTVYMIECEFHFTGDGVWTENHTQIVENFNNLLPDFPESLNKMYRYGLKSSAKNSN